MKSTKTPDVQRTKQKTKNLFKKRTRNVECLSKGRMTPIQEIAGCFRKYVPKKKLNIEKDIDGAVEKVAHERALKYQGKY
jgi:hypothetical protein